MPAWAMGMVLIMQFAVFVVALKILVGKFAEDISWWIAFVMAALLVVISMLFSYLMTPLILA